MPPPPRGSRPMFSGVFQHAIDAKGRPSLPSRFREVLSAQGADKLFITTDILDPCLQAYAPGQWTAFTERVAKLSAFDPVVRQLVRTFVAPAQQCPVDRLGRILLPPSPREHPGLVEEATWGGTVDRIEVWSPAGWAAAQKAARRPEGPAL